MMINKRCYLELTQVLDKVHRGWLSVESDNKFIELSYSTKIQKNEQGQYKIISGRFRGLTIKQFDKYFCYFTEVTEPHKQPKFINASLDIKKQLLVIDNKEIPATAKDIPEGVYSILEPIKTIKVVNSIYQDEKRGGNRFFDSWFPVISAMEQYPSRFLHFGRISNGCIVIPYDKSNRGSSCWASVFKKLLSSSCQETVICNLNVK